jgi:hypothetical protein
MRRTPLLLAIPTALALLACPPSGEKKATGAPSTACAKIGDPCEFSPGKLGSCVQKDECATPPCFVCQSQH